MSPNVKSYIVPLQNKTIKENLTTIEESEWSFEKRPQFEDTPIVFSQCDVFFFLLNISADHHQRLVIIRVSLVFFSQKKRKETLITRRARPSATQIAASWLTLPGTVICHSEQNFNPIKGKISRTFYD